MKSIRAHLTGFLLMVLTCLIIIGGVSILFFVRFKFLSEFDYSLKSQIDRFVTMSEMGEYEVCLDQEEDGECSEFVADITLELEDAEKINYFQIWSEDGTTVRRSYSLGTASLPRPDVSLRDLSDVYMYNLILPNGRRGRAAAIKLVFEDMALDWETWTSEQVDMPITSMTLVVARDRERLDKIFFGLWSGFIFGGGGFIALMILAVTRVVRNGLTPLDLLTRQITTINVNSLHRRFPSSKMPLELRPIAEQLNQLMNRLHKAFQREHRLTSGIAHELYTPLAELRTMAEVAIKWPDDPESTDNVVENVLDIAVQMQNIVNALLSISRFDAGLQEITCEPVQLSPVLDAVRNRIKNKITSKHITANWNIAPGICVNTDPAIFTSIISNLLENAVEYTPDNGTIVTRLEKTGKGCQLTISNTNENLVSADLPYLQEPLWRKEKARSGSSHSGFGLSLVAVFAAHLRITISMDLPVPDIFQVSLMIPSS